MYELSKELAEKRDRLLEILRAYGSVAVAYSGGLDSTVLAKAAQLALGERAVAVTADSPSLASGELEEARSLAELIGIRHLVIKTEEFSNPAYARNPANRCYFCKSELYRRLGDMLPEFGDAVIVNGANVDDLGDWRPGHKAADEYQVRSPLCEAGLSKKELRELARHWELPVWDKPATPCLSSRVAYGLELTPERMRQIDAAERFLKERGFRELRVRCPQPDTARIELPLDKLPQLVEPELRTELVEYFKQLGFKSISVDLEGLRSGSMNVFLPLDELRASATKPGSGNFSG